MRTTAVLVLAGILIGCGGSAGGRESSDGGGDYRAAVERSCARPDETATTIVPRSGKGELAVVADEWAAASRQLRQLEPPEARRDEHARLVDEVRRLERSARRLARLLGTRTTAGRFAATVIRTRSAADSVKVAAGLVEARGCGEATVAAADRMLTRPYFVMLRGSLRNYRRYLRDVDFEAPPAAALPSAAALHNGALNLHRSAGELEPPSALAESHGRMIDVVERLRDLTLPLGVRTESVGPERAARMLRRAREPARRLSRLERELLAGVTRELAAD